MLQHERRNDATSRGALHHFRHVGGGGKTSHLKWITSRYLNIDFC